MSLLHLDRLIKLMPPLTPPPENEVDWKMAENVFGLIFPEDYKQFIYTYGNVIWCDVFRAFCPDTRSLAACEESKVHYLNTLSIMYKAAILGSDNKPIGIPPYPEPGGLLPCLTDTFGGWLCWRTEGHPNDWTTVLYNGGNAWEFPMGLTKLIADWIEQIPPADSVWGSEPLEPDDYGLAR